LRLKALASAPSSLDSLNAEEDQDRGTFETEPLPQRNKHLTNAQSLAD
jgi:hypothetical protein